MAYCGGGAMQSLQVRLQAANARAEELQQATEEATRPLLRQLDALQVQMTNNAKTWQAVEDKYALTVYVVGTIRRLLTRGNGLFERLAAASLRLTAQLRQAFEERNAAVEAERAASVRVLELVRGGSARARSARGHVSGADNRFGAHAGAPHR